MQPQSVSAAAAAYSLSSLNAQTEQPAPANGRPRSTSFPYSLMHVNQSAANVARGVSPTGLSPYSHYQHLDMRDPVRRHFSNITLPLIPDSPSLARSLETPSLLRTLSCASFRDAEEEISQALIEAHICDVQRKLKVLQKATYSYRKTEIRHSIKDIGFTAAVAVRYEQVRTIVEDAIDSSPLTAEQKASFKAKALEKLTQSQATEIEEENAKFVSYTGYTPDEFLKQLPGNRLGIEDIQQCIRTHKAYFDRKVEEEKYPKTDEASISYKANIVQTSKELISEAANCLCSIATRGTVYHSSLKEMIQYVENEIDVKELAAAFIHMEAAVKAVGQHVEGDQATREFCSSRAQEFVDSNRDALETKACADVEAERNKEDLRYKKASMGYISTLCRKTSRPDSCPSLSRSSSVQSESEGKPEE